MSARLDYAEIGDLTAWAVGWTRDLFAALGEDVGQGKWSLRLQYKPMIRYIWLGALLMALGGLIAASDRRYRRASAVEEESAHSRGGALEPRAAVTATRMAHE